MSAQQGKRRNVADVCFHDAIPKSRQSATHPIDDALVD